MSKLGKERSKLGEFLDKNGLSQEWLIRESGLGRNTISDLASKKERSPTTRTMKKILNVLRQIDPKIQAEDFWEM